MQIEKGADVAVVVNRAWANLHGVKMFLRPNAGTQTDFRGVDESHVVFAKVLDAADAVGVWIEIKSESASADVVRMLIPWREVVTIAIAGQFTAAVKAEARRIGFTGERELE